MRLSRQTFAGLCLALIAAVLLPCRAGAEGLPPLSGDWSLASEDLRCLETSTSKDLGTWIQGTYRRGRPQAEVTVTLLEGKGPGPLAVPEGSVDTSEKSSF